jgi:6-phosphogluconolactonase
MQHDIHKTVFFDDRRDIAIPGNARETTLFCAEQFLKIGNAAIQERGVFNAALSGGSTPKAIFQLLASPELRSQIDWKNVVLFWSDERNVLPDDPQSNYKMAMDAGFASLPLKKENIHRMPAEGEAIEAEDAAKEYEKLILKLVPKASFDFVMLGMGEDGHTASLFPKTHGLHAEERLTIVNFVPQLNTWRMTLTYECINQSKNISIYVIGKNKAAMVKKVLSAPSEPDEFPIQKIGTRKHKALWILDTDAASELSSEIKTARI